MLWDKTLQDLYNSSGGTKAEFNNCFIFYSKQFLVLNVRLKTRVFTREYIAFIVMSLKRHSHVRILIYRTWAINNAISIGFFYEPRLATSRLRERRRQATAETAQDKVYIEPSERLWLMQKRIQSSCLSSTHGLYWHFRHFHQRSCKLLVRLQDKCFERNGSRPWLDVWGVQGKKPSIISVSFLSPGIYRLDTKNTPASNFFLLKTESNYWNSYMFWAKNAV